MPVAILDLTQNEHFCILENKYELDLEGFQVCVQGILTQVFIVSVGDYLILNLYFKISSG